MFFVRDPFNEAKAYLTVTESTNVKFIRRRTASEAAMVDVRAAGILNIIDKIGFILSKAIVY